MKRKSMIVGNWKMYKTVSQAKEYIHLLKGTLPSLNSKAYLAVPFTALYPLSEAVQNSPIILGAQNLYIGKEGAFTGEISGEMIREAGGQFVLIGHSERRNIFKETNEIIHEKLLAALNSNLLPIVCIGELKEDREEGRMESVLQKQLYDSLGSLTKEQLKKVVLAYEPVWAIGTGLTATPEIADQTQAYCRGLVSQKWGEEAGEEMSILYGGSVKLENAKILMEQPNVDGLLIGGASLDPTNFSKIISETKIME